MQYFDKNKGAVLFNSDSSFYPVVKMQYYPINIPVLLQCVISDNSFSGGCETMS